MDWPFLVAQVGYWGQVAAGSNKSSSPVYPGLFGGRNPENLEIAKEKIHKISNLQQGFQNPFVNFNKGILKTLL